MGSFCRVKIAQLIDYQDDCLTYYVSVNFKDLYCLIPFPTLFTLF